MAKSPKTKPAETKVTTWIKCDEEGKPLGSSTQTYKVIFECEFEDINDILEDIKGYAGIVSVELKKA